MKKEDIRACIMCIARDEDRFIGEFIENHLNLGFDKIFILDNNDPGDELVLEPNRKIELIRYNNIDLSKEFVKKQIYAYNMLFEHIKSLGYTHIMIIDIDEHIELRKHDNIKDFIYDEIIAKEKNIADIVWETYDDNDIIYEKDTKSTLRETYTRQQTKLAKYDYNNNEASSTKALFQVVDDVVWIINPHRPNRDVYPQNNIDPEVAVIRHYRTKCMETYFNHKVAKCNVLKTHFGRTCYIGYFEINQETPEKLEAFKKFCEEYDIPYDEEMVNGKIKELSKGKRKRKAVK